MDALRAVAKDIGRFLTFRYDLDNPLSTTERIAICVVTLVSCAVIVVLALLG